MNRHSLSLGLALLACASGLMAQGVPAASNTPPSAPLTPLKPLVPAEVTDDGLEPVPGPVAATARAPRRALPVWKLKIEAPDGLDDLLRSYLDLARFQSQDQVGPSENVVSRSELRRLVAAAPEQARALLEAEGYFNADVRVAMTEEVEGQPQIISIVVVPGPKATIDKVQMVFEGELDNRLGNADATAQALVDDLAADWSLGRGKAFRQALWTQAKNTTLATLRSQGYVTATWSGTSATVDAQANTARLFLVADSGPAFSYGELQVEGLKHQPESAIRNLMSFRVGDPYRERQVLDFQERVQKLNLFESVFVNVSDDPAQASAAPVTVKLREMPLQQATLGAGVSSDTGPRVSVEHLHRLLWGYPVQAKSKVQLGRDESLVQSDLTSHPRPGGKRWLGAFQFARQIDDDEAVTVSGRVRAGQSDEGDRLERILYAEYQRAQVTSEGGLKISEASALTVMQQWLWRDLDSPILPTTGLTANVQVGAGRSFSTLDTSGWFGRAHGRVTWYRPLPGQWYATVRGELGHVLADRGVGVPDTLLFRAGGDESVRGYGYRTLGVESDGVTLGGRALVTGSVEVARPVWSRFPSLWGALFADVGDAAEDFQALKPRLGYGAGVRWRSPVGPLRLDAAYGHDIHEFRLHFSVGIVL